MTTDNDNGQPTMRQRYKLAALTGLCANPSLADNHYNAIIARVVRYADQMMEDDNKRGQVSSTETDSRIVASDTPDFPEIDDSMCPKGSHHWSESAPTYISVSDAIETGFEAEIEAMRDQAC